MVIIVPQIDVNKLPTPLCIALECVNTISVFGALSNVATGVNRRDILSPAFYLTNSSRLVRHASRAWLVFFLVCVPCLLLSMECCYCKIVFFCIFLHFHA